MTSKQELNRQLQSAWSAADKANVRAETWRGIAARLSHDVARLRALLRRKNRRAALGRRTFHRRIRIHLLACVRRLRSR